jgi:enoyl-CoA hydratase
MSVYDLHLDLPGRNAIDDAFLERVEAGLRAAEGGAVLLRGTEQAFCAGLNLKLLSELEGDELEAFLGRADGFFSALWGYPGPVVGCVEGHAIAGGCLILQACDLRIVTDRAAVRIGANELALGACFPPNALALLTQRVPPQHMGRVVLGAELFSPQDALAVGLVDRVEADPLAAARAAAERMGGFPAEAFAYVKRELHAGAAADDAAVARWRAEALPQWSSPELRGRIRAVLGG